MEAFGADKELSSDHRDLLTSFSNPLPPSLPDPSPAIAFPLPGSETFDVWKEQSHITTDPIPAQPAHLSFGSGTDDLDALRTVETNGSEMAEMLSKRTAKLSINPRFGDESTPSQIISESSLSDDEKRQALQSKLSAAASNGNMESLNLLLSSPALDFVDINLPDADGSPALIYAACFGHAEAVQALLNAGADVNAPDRNHWTALMWALIGASSAHKTIAKVLLDFGADPAAKSSTGRSAADFAQQNPELGGFLNQSGYQLGAPVISEGFGEHNPLAEEYAQREFMRRMMMESSANLEVDLGDLDSDLNPPSLDEDLGQDFVWDRCLNDQMFVFQESDLGRILDIIITNMTPKRSPSQKPVPANILFLAARYAHYYVGPELLDLLLVTAMDKINKAVEEHQWDMTILAFWISNATLLLHYLRKDTNLSTATTDFQVELADLINEIFVLIVRDAERRIDKVFDAALLQYEIVPGLDDVTFQGEWTLFKRRPKPEMSPEKRIRPPSPRQRAKTSPQTVTSLLSSTLFVLDLYDIHSVITTQVLAQLLYWIGTEMFNRIMSNRRYLARTKAMQIRMNLAHLEEWVQSNNRTPEHYEGGDMTAKGENTIESARLHFAPVIQLLQWLQCFSSMGDDLEGLLSTLDQLPALNPNQLLHAANRYRPEVGEPELPKPVREYLNYLRTEMVERFRREVRDQEQKQKRVSVGSVKSAMSAKSGRSMFSSRPRVLSPQRSVVSDGGTTTVSDELRPPDRLLLDPSLMLPFYLPTPTDMVVRFGAGFGGMDKERERKYIPTVPPEFLSELDEGSGSGPTLPPQPLADRFPDIPSSGIGDDPNDVFGDDLDPGWDSVLDRPDFVHNQDIHFKPAGSEQVLGQMSTQESGQEERRGWRFSLSGK